MGNNRKTWDSYFIDIARMVAERSTCPRLSVGAVIVKDKRIISTGYNGSPRNAPHCDDIGCLLVNNHCVRTLHAEHNAIVCPEIDVRYSTLYVTHNPCMECFKTICQAEIRYVVYGELYKPVDYASLGISLNRMPEIIQLKTGATSS